MEKMVNETITKYYGPYINKLETNKYGKDAAVEEIIYYLREKLYEWVDRHTST